MIYKNWMIVSGCERLTPGCNNCPSYWEYHEQGLDYHPIEHQGRLLDPILNKTPTVYTVAVGSDLFHEAITIPFIKDVFKVMNKATWHSFELVTKRAERMEYLSSLKWSDNITAGVSVEEARYTWRIDCLRNVKANRLVSFGPMTGPMGKLNLNGIETAGIVTEHWGPNPRIMKKEWIEEIRDQCKKQGVSISETHWLSINNEEVVQCQAQQQQKQQ